MKKNWMTPGVRALKTTSTQAGTSASSGEDSYGSTCDQYKGDFCLIEVPCENEEKKVACKDKLIENPYYFLSS